MIMPSAMGRLPERAALGAGLDKSCKGISGLMWYAYSVSVPHYFPFVNTLILELLKAGRPFGDFPTLICLQRKHITFFPACQGLISGVWACARQILACPPVIQGKTALFRRGCLASLSIFRSRIIICRVMLYVLLFYPILIHVSIYVSIGLA